MAATNKPLLLDGALGTELERRGVITTGPSWTAYANRDHSELIRQIHEEYIASGANIITANTFRTNPRAVGSEAESLTRRAVEIARQAAYDRNVLVAGSIAPVEDCFSPELVDPSSQRLEAEHEQLARWLADAGADLILIETMNSNREAVAATRAARSATSLPVYVSLVPLDGDHLLDGTLIAEAVNALADEGANLVALNCAPVSVMRLALPGFARAARAKGIAFGCYPNASERKPDGSWDLNASSDAAIAALAEEWLNAGATLIGSCCGTTPRTTAVLKSLISTTAV